MWPAGGVRIRTAIFVFSRNVRGPLSFEVWGQFVSAGQSNYRAAWSDRLARSEQSVCSTLTFLPLSGWPCCRGHIRYRKHLYVSARHRVKGNVNTYCWMPVRTVEGRAGLSVFLRNSPFMGSKVAEPSAELLQKTRKSWKHQPNISFDLCPYFMFLGLCCSISFFSFTKCQKAAVSTERLASCPWSILLSCCEMKLLHAQLSPGSQTHGDKTLMKTCQLWVCGKAFQSESECVFKVKIPDGLGYQE